MVRFLRLLPGMLLCTLLVVRGGLGLHAKWQLERAWALGQQSRVLIPTCERQETAPACVRGATGRALAHYAAAMALMPQGGAIHFAWLPAGTDLAIQGPAWRLNAEHGAELAACLKTYDRALELAERGATTNYRLELSEAFLPDSMRRHRGIDAWGVDRHHRGILGLWSLQSLLRARAVEQWQDKRADAALQSCVVALRLLDYLASTRSLDGEALRLKLLVEVANTMSAILVHSRPKAEYCRIAIAAIRAVPFWEAMIGALQGTTYDDIVAVYERSSPASSWWSVGRQWAFRPQSIAEQATYVEHMAQFSRYLAELRHECSQGRPWASAMNEGVGRFYVGDVLRNAVSARIALSLAALRAAAQLQHHQRSGAPFSMALIDKSLLDAGMQVDPWSGRAYEATERAGKLVIYSVGADGNDDGGNVRTDVLFPQCY